MRTHLTLAALACLPLHLAPAQSAPIRTLVEEMRIDGNQQEWTRVSDVHVAANGSIVVRHPDDFGLTVFSPTGTMVKHLVRKGAGPGEARSISRSGFVGDSLYITDAALRRITLLNLEGEVIRTIPAATSSEWLNSFAPSSLYSSRSLMPSWLLPNGEAIGGGTIPIALTTSHRVNNLTILRMGWDGNATGVMYDMPFGRDHAYLVIEGMPNSFFRQPLLGDPAIAASPDGRHFAVADAVDGKNSIELSFIAPSGKILRRASVAHTPALVTPRVVDSAVAAVAAYTKRVGHEAAIRRQLAVPKYDFPIRRLLLERDGTAWIELRGAGPVREWLVVSPQGTLKHRVHVPANTQILLVDKGIWGVVLDENDVPSVARFRLK